MPDAQKYLFVAADNLLLPSPTHPDMAAQSPQRPVSISWIFLHRGLNREQKSCRVYLIFLLHKLLLAPYFLRLLLTNLRVKFADPLPPLMMLHHVFYTNQTFAGFQVLKIFAYQAVIRH